jgi:unsaturated rhamnogalacturonyl hydrolase
MANAHKAYNAIIKEFIETDASGQVNLKGTVAVSGLGGKPYRDGSFEYYMSEPVIVNDPKGMGAFINCAVEMEMSETQAVGNSKTVLLDQYYNNEWKKDANDTLVSWHYTWNDKSNGGFAMLGDMFNRYGVKTKSLTTAPTVQALKQAAIYIIVDPDTEKESQKPNFISTNAITAISNWVKAGGVLVLMGNDSGNAEFKNFNLLGANFGIQFNENSKNRVQGSQFEQGSVITPGAHSIFGSSKKLYIKEYSSLQVKSPAVAVIKNGEDNVMAVAKYGSGTVFAIGDPWIYNEYLDGRKLPAEFENYKAAEELIKWLIRQTKKK